MEELKIIFKDWIKRKIIDLTKKFLHWKTPMDVVISILKSYRIFPQPLIALDIFSMCGLRLTADYAPYCDYLEMWEINPIYARFAQKFFPKAKVRIVDSIKTVKEGNIGKKYNFVVIDNYFGYFGVGYCEHFDLFPYIFELLDKKAIIILNVLQDMRGYCNKKEISKEWISKRKEFYLINKDEEVINLNLIKAIEAYKKKIPRNFDLKLSFIIPRNLFVFFLVMYLEQKTSL